MRAGSRSPSTVTRAGKAAIEEALRSAAAGQTLHDDDAAWLTLLLALIPIRDEAWKRCDGSNAQQQLWSDLTRRADPALAAAPATLLAFNAYLAGDGALADVALQRALHTEPDYRMAQLLGRARRGGIHPNKLRHRFGQ